MKTHFLTKLVQFYRCRFCSVDFVFNNQLYKHLRIIYNKSRFSTKEIIVKNSESVIISATESLSLIIFYVSKVVHSNITNVTTKEYVFLKTSLRHNLDNVRFNKIELRALFRHGIYYKFHRSKVSA